MAKQRSTTFWDDAYAKVKQDSPELVRKYEVLVSKEYLKGASYTSSDKNQIAEIIKIGQKRVEDETMHIGSFTVPELVGKAAQVAIWAKDWIDFAVQASPEASTAWAIASLALPLLIRPATAEEDCKSGLVYVTNRMVYYNALEDALADLNNQFKEDLTSLYEQILQYQMKAVLRCFRGPLKNWGRDIITRDDWSGMLSGIKGAETNLHQMVTQNTAIASQVHLKQLAAAADAENLKLDQQLKISEEHLAVSEEIRDILATQSPLQQETLAVLRDIAAKLSINAVQPAKPSPTALKLMDVNRDDRFIKRDDLMNSLRQKCSRTASTTALIGLGGTGKSQIAIEYAYETFAQGKSIFWIYAASLIRYEQGIRAIARKVGLESWNDTKIDIFSLVQEWLENEEHGSWLLVLDNLDDSKFLDNIPNQEQSYKQPLKSYLRSLRSADHGSILITTQSQEAARSLVDDRDFVFVQPMNESEAVALLRSSASNLESDPDCAELVKELDLIPLAIVQAAGFIGRRKWSVAKYLETFRKNDAQKSKLLTSQSNDLRRDIESPSSIIATWQITFDHLKEDKPSAANLLAVLSLFDRNRIQKDIIVSNSDKEDSTYEEESSVSGRENSVSGEEDKTLSQDNEFDISMQSYKDDDMAFEDDLLVLQEYFLITMKAEGQSIQMHRLVQLSMFSWLQKSKKLAIVTGTFLGILRDALESHDDVVTFEGYTKFVPHFEAAKSLAPKSGTSALVWASVLSSMAHCMAAQGRNFEVEVLYQDSLTIRSKLLGDKDPVTLLTKFDHANAQLGCGRTREGEINLRELLSQQTEILGSEHTQTMETSISLAESLIKFPGDNKGSLEEADILFTAVLENARKSYGTLHSTTLEAMDRMAALRIAQKRFLDAERIQLELIELSTQHLGAKDIDTLNRRLTLMELYRDYLDCTRLEETFEIVNLVYEAAGKESGNSMLAELELAQACQDQYLEEETIKILVDLIRTSEQLIGPTSVIYCLSVLLLTALYLETGDVVAMESLVPDLAKIISLDEGHSNKLVDSSVSILGAALVLMGRFGEAEALVKRGLAKEPDQKSFRIDWCSKAILTLLYWKQGRKEELKAMIVEVIPEKMFAGNDFEFDMIEGLNTVAGIFYASMDFEEAEQKTVLALKLYEEYSAKHFQKLATRTLLASIQRKQGKLAEADVQEVAALELILVVLANKVFSTWSKILLKLGRMYRELDLTVESDELNDRFLKVLLRILKEDHLKGVTMAETIAVRYKERNQLEDAQRFETEVLSYAKSVITDVGVDAAAVLSLADLKNLLEQSSKKISG